MEQFESKISKFSGKRKIIEVPANVRDGWQTGTKVTVSPLTGGEGESNAK